MKITAVDNHKDLFYIQDFYPNWLLDLLKNPYKFDYEEVLVENRPVRRNLFVTFWIRPFISLYSKFRCWQISKELNKKVSLVTYGLWLDIPKYSMDKHNDHMNHVIIGMQIYLTDGLENLGTCFYNQDHSIRHAFKYKKNTGYLMINNEKQIHAMPNPVPTDNFRLSSYHWLTYD